MEAYGLAVDRQGNVYFADFNDPSVRKVFTNGIIDRVAGTGVYGFSGSGGLAKETQVEGAHSVWVDAQDNLWFTDTYRIYKVDVTTGVLQTIVGGGTGNPVDGVYAPSVRLSASPSAVLTDVNGNQVFAEANRLRKAAPFPLHSVSPPSLQLISPTNDTVIMYLSAQLQNGTMRVVKLNPETKEITTVAGGGSYFNPNNAADYGDGKLATEVRLLTIGGVTLDQAGNLYISEAYSNRIRKVDAQTKIITTFLGAAGSSVIEPTYPIALGNLGSVHINPADNRLYFLSNSGPTRIYVIDLLQGGVSVLAGTANGPVADEGRLATEINLDPATHLQTDKQGILYLGEGNKNRIRKLSPAP